MSNIEETAGTAMPTAKGLLHRAIIQSGANLRSTEIEDANKSTETFLAKLKPRK